MKISSIRATPLRLPYKVPYHWPQGVFEAADIVLVSVESDTDIVGHGESVAPPSAAMIAGMIGNVAPALIGQSPFDIARIREAVDMMATAKQPIFYAGGGVINSGTAASQPPVIIRSASSY